MPLIKKTLAVDLRMGIADEYVGLDAPKLCFIQLVSVCLQIFYVLF